MRPANALRLYWVRLRARIVQESLAVAGIAAGVALLFASQVANTSLQGSAAQLSRGIVGSATLQLVARSPNGFPESTLQRVREIRGVRVAAPILEAGANAVGPRGSESVELIGADASLSKLGGSLVRRTALSPFGGIGAVVLPAPLAQKLGVTKFGAEVELEVAGRTELVPLYAQLHKRQIGPLIDSPVAIAPLSFAQEVAGLPARVSRILVAPATGSETSVRTALSAIAGGRLNVESTDYDQRLFAQAATASNQSTSLFSVISALVGFLFAFNATLLTVPQRRRLIAELRSDGYTPGTVIAMLLIDGLLLGLFACALGLALGEELSIHAFRSEPALLSLAFAVGAQRIVSAQSIAIAAGGGMLAALLAVLSPLRDILARDPLAAIAPREQGGITRAGARLALVGLVSLALATVLLLVAPDAAVPGMVLLVCALLLELPLMLSTTLTLVSRIARAIVSPVPHAATEVWVAPSGSYNLLQTTPFAPRRRRRLERLPGVQAVHVYRSGLLDYGRRRTLVIAPSSSSSPLLPAGQIVQGDPGQAEARVRAGAWVVLSKALAEEQHLRIGEAFRLPSPEPTSFRVAALSTNVGWAPGAIIMNAGEYAHAWGSQDISAYSVVLGRNVAPAACVREIRRLFGPPASSGLSVQTGAQHAAGQQALARGALARLSQIAALIPLIAVPAMAAAVGAMGWHTRPRLAKLQLEGLSRAELWQTILLESLLLLSVGCVGGAIFGLYGQQLADRALASAIGFPVVYSVAPLTALWSLLLVPAAALAILAVPGYMAASVPAALALQE